MLNEQKYEKALENLRILERKDNFKKWGGQVAPQINCDVFEQLIKEHFELVKKYDELYERHSKILDDVHDYRYETQSMKMTIRNLCKHFGVKNEEELKNIYLCKPYILEDLKVGMWVYDIIWEECFEICEIFPKDNEIHVLIHQNRINVKRYEPIKFEEGRFYPVTKALCNGI